MAFQSSALSSVIQDVYKIFYCVFMYSEFEISLMGKQKRIEITSRYLIPFFILWSCWLFVAFSFFFFPGELKKKAFGIVEDDF